MLQSQISLSVEIGADQSGGDGEDLPIRGRNCCCNNNATLPRTFTTLLDGVCLIRHTFMVVGGVVRGKNNNHVAWNRENPPSTWSHANNLFGVTHCRQTPPAQYIIIQKIIKRKIERVGRVFGWVVGGINRLLWMRAPSGRSEGSNGVVVVSGTNVAVRNAERKIFVKLGQRCK